MGRIATKILKYRKIKKKRYKNAVTNMPKKDKKVPEDKKYTYYNERRQSKKGGHLW